MSGPPSENWQALTGPSGWFRLWYPPQWTVREGDVSQTLHPPGSGAFFAISGAWSTSDDPADHSLFGDSGGPFPNVRNVRTVEEPELPFAVESRSGESAFNLPAKWWLKPFRQGKWRGWQVWVLRNGPVVVIATLLHDRETDPELTTLCRMVLRSIEFAENPADPPEQFTTRVLQLAREKFPLLDCERTGELQLTIGESTLNLFNFYRSYTTAPDRFEEIVLPALTTVVQVQEWGSAQTKPELAAVENRIMPMLYPEAVWQSKFSGFVGSPWVAGLAVMYVVDEANAYWYIPHDLLEQWEIDLEQLHSLSLKNLDRYFESHPMELAVAGTEEGDASMLIPGKSDAYNAARLVSEDFATRLREVVGGDLAVGLPGRDFFVAVSLKSPDMVQHVRGRVHEDFAHMDHPLTDRLLLLTTDGVSEYFDAEPS
ncbi:MAG: DUF1444 family protein [Planctomycetota bacterium]|nr:MAG: DUF1444 family protein [Planctomycetota bacterium]